MNDFYGKRYKKMAIIPTILIIPLLFLILVYPGISPGIDLTGGNVIILRSSHEMSEQKILSALQPFKLPEIKVSTIISPTGYGAWISYGKDPTLIQAEDLLSKAQLAIDNSQETEAMNYSNQLITFLGGQQQQFANSKLALIAAQDSLAVYKENFSKQLQDALTNGLGLGSDVEFQKREVSATLGAATFQSTIFILVLGFVLIVIIIFIAFRQLIPSAAIIEAMIFDMLFGLLGMAALGIPLSLVTISALLMLIGYSIDTDILLTSRMLKNKDGTPGERATKSMKTGLTMTGTTLVALAVMIIVSYFYQIEVIYQIAAVLFFGLIGDVIATWFMNAPILLWFLERKEKYRG